MPHDCAGVLLEVKPTQVTESFVRRGSITDLKARMGVFLLDRWLHSIATLSCGVHRRGQDAIKTTGNPAAGRRP